MPDPTDPARNPLKKPAVIVWLIVVFVVLPLAILWSTLRGE